MRRSSTAALERVREALVDLLNDPGLSDRTRLRQLEQLGGELDGFIFDLQARLPESRRRGGWDRDLPRI